MNSAYDCIVVGGGSGGLTVARSLARAGKKVALVEKHILGGDCTNYGCVPSKALLSFVRSTPGTGLGLALEHVRSVRAGVLVEEDAHALEKDGIDVHLGTGTVVRAGVVEVTDATGIKKEYDAKKIVLATGSMPVRIDVLDVAKEKVITNEELFELRDIPQNRTIKMCILGGGYIGCEMAEALQCAGVAVTVVQREDRLVPREEKESSEVVREFLINIGVSVQLNSSLEKIVVDGHVSSLDEFDYIVLALGRTPRVPGGLAEVGVEVTRGIVVDAYNETKVKGVYAIGDCVANNPTFTHWANNEGRGLVRNILFPWWRASVRAKVLPAVLYTELEVARVGKTEEDIKKEWGEQYVASSTFCFTYNDRAKVEGETRGFVKIIYSRLRGTVLGGSIVGLHAGEMLPRLVTAVENGETVYSLSQDVYAYPTRAEGIKKAADTASLAQLRSWRSIGMLFVRTYGSRIVAAVIWLAAVYSMYLYLRSINETPLMLAEHVYMFVNATWYGPVAYMFLYMFRALFLLPATLITVLSGVMFGPIFGPMYTWVGENMSAQLSYFVGRFFRGETHAHTASGLLARLENTSAFTGVVMARLLFMPFDVFNYAAGAARIQWRGYTLGTMLGIIPGMTAFVLAGAALDPATFFATGEFTVAWGTLLLAIVIILGAIGVSKLLKK